MAENDWVPDSGAPLFPPGPVPGGHVPQPPAGAAPGPAPTPDQPFLDVPGSVPSTKIQAWLWLVFAVAGFLVGQIVALAAGSVAGVVAGESSAQMKVISLASEPPEWYVVSTLLGLWLGFFGAPWVACRAQGTRHFLRDMGVRFKLIDLVGIVIGLGGQLLIGILYAPFQHEIHNFNAPSQKLTGGSHGGGFLVIALATVIAAPFMEELFFRGLLLKSLVRLWAPVATTPGVARATGVVVAVVIDGLLFGLAHGELVQLAGLAVFGMMLATVSYRTGRLGMNMVAHASFNLVAVIVILHQRGGVIF
jgi:membrane protease YdiL (CAAX protease family)